MNLVEWEVSIPGMRVVVGLTPSIVALALLRDDTLGHIDNMLIQVYCLCHMTNTTNQVRLMTEQQCFC